MLAGVYVVTAKATIYRDSDLGPIVLRSDESIGAVPIEGLKGEAKANAMMKAETKAKRRVTLSLSGLGMLDETEIDSIPTSHAPREATALPAPPPDEMCVPNYGPDAGKPFSQVSVEYLKDYLAGAERSIKDPKKANFLQKNEAMRDALKLEIDKREGVASGGSSRPDPATPIGEVSPLGTLTPLKDLTISGWGTLLGGMENDPDLADLLTMVKEQCGLKSLAYPKVSPKDRVEFLTALQTAAQANGLGPRVTALGL